MQNSEFRIHNSKLVIGWLYPDLMSTYGDRGNVLTLQRRCEWRDIDVLIEKVDIDTPVKSLKACDLIFMGGAQDRQQKIVADDLAQGKAEALTDMINNNTPGLYICGAYQFLGKYYKEADGTIIDGLGVLDLYTVNPGHQVPRLTGNILADSQFSIFNSQFSTLVGFENHGGRTYLGKDMKPLGKVTVGFGNNGEDHTEGVIYKNTIGSYMHGPILPKNPHLADYLIEKALEIKYKEQITLKSLDDTLETQAHQAIAKKLGVEL